MTDETAFESFDEIAADRGPMQLALTAWRELASNGWMDPGQTPCFYLDQHFIWNESAMILWRQYPGIDPVRGVAWVDLAYVLPEDRRAGCYRHLLNMLTAEAWPQCTEIRLAIHRDNAVSLAAHKALGFQPNGQHPDYPNWELFARAEPEPPYSLPRYNPPGESAHG